MINKDFISSLLKSESKKISVFSRREKNMFDEKVYGEDAMRLFYGNPTGVALTTRFLVNRWLSNIYGAYNDSGLSQHKIEEFAKMLGIDLSECEKDISEYQSFNEFFARRLKADARPLPQNDKAFASPGDGRLLVFQNIDESVLSYVKWAPIKLFDLFNKNNVLAERYTGGTCGVLRLCPADYHRFHFPADGKVGVTKTVPGVLHSVNPYALENKIPVYSQNKRTLCTLDSKQFGKILLMEVGAMFVGSIVQTYRSATEVKRGDEKGYFKFGGSTCIFFVEKGRMQFDQDLVQKSSEGIETLVHMGEQLGTATV